jgi:hypothetical protein
MNPQEKAKAAISQLPRLYREFDSGMQDDKGLHDIIIGLELLRQIANGTHVIVPVEPIQAQRNHVDNLVSIFIADDDHLRDVSNDLIVRSYRAMVRTMINEAEWIMRVRRG